MIFDNIKKRLDELSISTGTLPYILKPFKVDGNIKEYIPQRHLKEYTKGIAFFISEFYTRDDFHDYLIHSKEYFNLTNEDKRIDYLNLKMENNSMIGKTSKCILLWELLCLKLKILAELMKRYVPLTFSFLKNQ